MVLMMTFLDVFVRVVTSSSLSLLELELELASLLKTRPCCSVCAKCRGEIWHSSKWLTTCISEVFTQQLEDCIECISNIGWLINPDSSIDRHRSKLYITYRKYFRVRHKLAWVGIYHWIVSQVPEPASAGHSFDYYPSPPRLQISIDANYRLPGGCLYYVSHMEDCHNPS